MANETKKILIVEDEKMFRELFIEKLQEEGFSAFEAEDGEKGLKLALKEKPDLILLDILMPVMDGLTMMKKLREDSWGKNVDVILLTNLSATEESTIKAMVDYEPLYYLVKSAWSFKDIMEKIKETLNAQNTN
jgi:two-component system response regulator VicR